MVSTAKKIDKDLGFNRAVSFRRQLYVADNIVAKISDKRISYDSFVIDFTPHGLGLFVPDISFCKIEKCSLVDLKVSHAGGDTISENEGYVAYVGKYRLGSKDGFKIGISFVSNEERAQPESEVRRKERFPCPDYFMPTAYCQDLISFNEFIFFQVFDLSAAGMQLRTSLRNKSLFPNMHNTFTVNMPMHGIFKIECKVVYVKKSDEEYLVGLKFIDPDQKFSASVSEYLFATSNVTLRSLQKAGMPVHGIERGLTFTYPSSEQDWDEIACLRKRAYQAAGKFGGIEDAKATIDEFDAYARHIICKVHRKVIAAGRVVFVNDDKERSEHHKLGVAVPDWVWEKSVCEFSRACTHPNYRGSDIFINLLRQFGRVAYQGGADIVLANCNDNLWPMYKKVGFKKVGVKFDAFGTKDCHLIYTDIRNMFKGSIFNFIGWNQVVYPMVKFIGKGSGAKFFVQKFDFAYKKIYTILRSLKFSKNKKRRK